MRADIVGSAAARRVAQVNGVAMAADMIIEGVHKGKKVTLNWTGGWCIDGQNMLPFVSAYEVADENHRIGMGVGGAAAGALLLGPLGLMAGGAMGTRKKRLGVIVWNDGQQSLIQIKSHTLHKALLQASMSNTMAEPPEAEPAEVSMAEPPEAEPAPIEPQPKPYVQITDAIRQLASLRENGLISEAEYDSKRSDLLSRL